MEIITGTEEFHIEADTAVAIGKFDGVHLGHRRILEEILKKREEGLRSCVFTFDPSPAVLFGKGDVRELTTREEKRLLLQRMGVEILIEYPLSYETAATPPEAFVRETLIGRLGASLLAAGPDLSFGAGGKGDLALLRRLAPESGLEIREIPKLLFADGEETKEISSSLIRSFVEAGRMEEAGECLGTPYPILGQVVPGAHLGHTLGFPTVNVEIPEEKLLPPFGVYTSVVTVEGREYTGITNIGCKPTVTSGRRPLAETYLYDFDEEIYGKEVLIGLKSFKRPERKFPDVEALKEQLRQDIESCRP
ncbi:MAG: riboflavin biosynthesis protein RibF [Lachnospiraceae bacterium]|nr:riboflavin biosynthesis protein RibF [Lachnospiraceae bacterium]